jgi:two-component system response regulator MprA
MTYKILIVEDDKNIREFLEEAFKESGYSVKSTGDGAQAIKMVKEAKPDTLVLDLGIENIAGETVCAEIKKMHPELPIIILTAKNTSGDIVRGFDLGADDYMSKPFEIDELLARVRARLKQKGTSILEIGDLKLDSSKYEVKKNGKLIPLTSTEFKLLEYLMINQGVVLSRESILDHIWLYSPDIESRVVDVYIGYLRKKIDSGSDMPLIKSVRGFGYTIRE